MAVTEVLITVVRIGFGGVIAFGLCGEGGDEAGALLQIQMDVAFQADAVSGVFSGRQIDSSTSGLGGGFDGTVDGRRVDGAAVGFGSEIFHIIEGSLEAEAEN